MNIAGKYFSGTYKDYAGQKNLLKNLVDTANDPYADLSEKQSALNDLIRIKGVGFAQKYIDTSELY